MSGRKGARSSPVVRAATASLPSVVDRYRAGAICVPWGAVESRARGRDRLRSRQLLLVAHAGYYVLTGVWPLVPRRTFEKVTGSKEDFWLAQTVGVLVGAIGLGLAQNLRRSGAVSAELQTVAVASAAGLALADVVFVSKGCIRRIYLLDAFAEAALVAAWLRTSRS